MKLLTLIQLLMSALLIFNISCSDKKKSRNKTQAPPVNDFFDVNMIPTADAPLNPTADAPLNPTADAPLKGSDRAQIKIHNTAFKKQFLLQGETIRQTQIPMFGSMKSRVVYFEKTHDQILLIESNNGHSVTNDMPQKLVITTFPIIKSEGDFTAFDFNKGMTKLFLVDDWRGRTSAPDYSKEFQTAKILNSFIDSAYFTTNNEKLVLEQVALADFSSVNTPFRINYYLSLYTPNESFVPTKAPKNFNNFAFFEVAPLYKNDGTTVSYASKHDISSPVTYAVSENTPAEFKQAVKDGVLYWNKALGREAFIAIDGPKGVTAPNPNYNVVQWVNWDQAGFAYADAQMDPHNGQITHAQVFMTSVFAVSSIQRAKIYLRKIQNQDPSLEMLVLKGLSNKPLCNAFAKQDQFKRTLEFLVESNATDTQVLEVSKDYIREVMAHEIGHTMGLRHNFTSSLSTNMKQSEREGIFKEYFLTQNAPLTVVPANSVMEYSQFYEAALIGDLIEKAPEALDYDTKVMKYLYLNESPSEWPLYCTDDHSSKFADCNRFDTGSNIADYVKSTFHSQINDLPHRVIRIYANAKLEGKDLNSVSLNVSSYLTRIMNMRGSLYSLFTDKGLLLETHRSFARVDAQNISDVRAAQDSRVKELVIDAGAAENFTDSLLVVAPTIEDHFHGPLYHGMEDLLKSGKYDRWDNGNGNVIVLTDEDKAIIYKTAHEFFEKLEYKLVKADLAALNLLKFTDNALSLELIGFLNEKVQSYVFAQSSHLTEDNKNAFEFKIDDKVFKGELKSFVRPAEIRLEAAKLLAGTKSKTPGWAMAERHANGVAYEALFKSSFKDNKLPDLNRKEVPQNVRRFILENKKITAILKR